MVDEGRMLLSGQAQGSSGLNNILNKLEVCGFTVVMFWSLGVLGCIAASFFSLHCDLITIIIVASIVLSLSRI